MSNPYWTLVKKERKRSEKTWANVVLLVVAIALAPFSKDTLLYFLENPSQAIAGIEGLAFRLSALVGAAVALTSYQQIIRTSEREVLGSHPVQPKLWFSALFRKTFLHTWIWPWICSALAWPMLLHNLYAEFGLLCLVNLIGWLSMLCIGYLVHLGSVWVARSEISAPLLDAIRGNNPREQAAFIYAPGFALFFCGLLMMLCSFSIDGVLQRHPPAFGFFVLPLLVGVIALFFAHRLSESQLVPASAVLAEVDARWATLDEAQHESAVYLEWLANDRKELLRALRQGWRGLRIWPMGIWGFGLFAFVSALGSDLEVAMFFSSLGAVGGCTIGVVLSRYNPIWLDEQLNVQGRELFWARFWVCLLYAQGAIVPLLFFMLGPQIIRIAIVEVCVLVAAGVSAYLSVYQRKHGLLLFLPAALFLIFLGLL